MFVSRVSVDKREVHRVAKNAVTLGRTAEERVAHLLLKQGWRILARNQRWIGYEVDLIIQRESLLVIAEVKLRSNRNATSLFGARKRRCLMRGARRFLAELAPADIETLRFDLFLVSPSGQVLHLPDVLPLNDEGPW